MERQEQPTTEELINKIMFLKEALKFYSVEDNYRAGAIGLDKGHQARFALEQLNGIDKYNQEMIDESMKSVGKYNNETFYTDDLTNEFIDKMEQINNLIKKYKNE